MGRDVTVSRDQHNYVDSESIRGGEGSQIEEDENVLKFTGMLLFLRNHPCFVAKLLCNYYFYTKLYILSQKLRF